MADKKYTHFDEEIDKYNLAGEHALAIAYVMLVLLCIAAVVLNLNGAVDTFINSFGN